MIFRNWLGLDWSKRETAKDQRVRTGNRRRRVEEDNHVEDTARLCSGKGYGGDGEATNGHDAAA